MVEFEIGLATDWTPGVGGHGAVLAFSWLPWRYDEIKSRRDGPRTGNRHFPRKKWNFTTNFGQDPKKKVTVLTPPPRGPSTPTFWRARSPRRRGCSRPLFFWVNQKTGPNRGAKFRGELSPQSWDTEASLPCASSCAQPVQDSERVYTGRILN